MGLLVYKISDYSHTAEREQYRAICQMLKSRFSEKSELCIFVANWNIYDSELDGLLIKQDAIIAIEFKNYNNNCNPITITQIYAQVLGIINIPIFGIFLLSRVTGR